MVCPKLGAPTAEDLFLEILCLCVISHCFENDSHPRNRGLALAARPKRLQPPCKDTLVQAERLREFAQFEERIRKITPNDQSVGIINAQCFRAPLRKGAL